MNGSRGFVSGLESFRWSASGPKDDHMRNALVEMKVSVMAAGIRPAPPISPPASQRPRYASAVTATTGFTDREQPIARRGSRSVHPVATGYFRAGIRKNEQMQLIVEQISNEDIRNLGAYFASLSPPKGPSPTMIRSVRGRANRPPRTALRVMPTGSYSGTKAVARVAGQREDYLFKALRDYKSGVRSGGGQAAWPKSPIR